jgi:excisionase family DNA binding protein
VTKLHVVMNSIHESADFGANDRASVGLLRKRELAPQLGISKRTLDVWMAQGRVPFLKIGRSVRFRLSDVLEKLNAFRVN